MNRRFEQLTVRSEVIESDGFKFVQGFLNYKLFVNYKKLKGTSRDGKTYLASRSHYGSSLYQEPALNIIYHPDRKNLH